MTLKLNGVMAVTLGSLGYYAECVSFECQQLNAKVVTVCEEKVANESSFGCTAYICTLDRL